MINETISVIVPIYNLKDYLARSVESLTAQRYPSLEIILVDDGSRDGSGELADRLAAADPRIRVIHQENGGVTSARLAGISAASGSWIGFLDGDDLAEPEMYQRLYANALRCGADISHCGYKMVFPNRTDDYYNSGIFLEQDRQSGLRELLSGDRVEPTLCTKLYRKSLFDAMLTAGEMDPTIRNMEDLLMNFYLFRRAKKSVYEDVCLYRYMVRSASAATSAPNAQKLSDPRRVFETILSQLDDAELQAVVKSRLAATLIGLSTMKVGNHRALIAPHRASARTALKAMRRELLTGTYSRKLKLQTRWVCLWPGSYAAAHRIYGRLSGHDRKYEV